MEKEEPFFFVAAAVVTFYTFPGQKYSLTVASLRRLSPSSSNMSAKDSDKTRQDVSQIQTVSVFIHIPSLQAMNKRSKKEFFLFRKLNYLF